MIQALSPAALVALTTWPPHCAGDACSISARREQALIEALDVAVYTVDTEGRLVFYNAAAAELWGRRPPLGDTRWCGSLKLFLPDGTPLAHEECPMAVCLRERRPVRGDWAQAERPDGSRVAFVSFPTPLFNAAGEFTGAVNVLVDISDLQAAEAARHAIEERFHAAQEASPEGFLVADPLRGPDGVVQDFTITYANPAATRIFARDRTAMEGERLRRVLGGHPRIEQLLAAYARVLETGEPQQREAVYRVDGRRAWIRSRTVRLGGGIAIACEDITDRRMAESRIRHLALHDPLTGVGNRAAFQERLAEAARAGTGVAVLSLDLDGFRAVNDALGHAVGDALLRGAAMRMEDCLTGSDAIARLGGDEFALLLTGPDLRARAGAMARRIAEAMAPPFQLGDYRASIGATIGIAVAAGAEMAGRPEELLRQADLALQRARQEARGGCRFFAAPMAAALERRVGLHVELREALGQGGGAPQARGGISLHYQPIFDLRQHRPVGFEALLRWTHPRLGPIAPLEFIPIAEETGLILPLGEWALRRACADAATWPAGMKVAVNLSPVQFVGGEVTRAVQAALQATGLDPARLELEVTESVLLQQSEAVLASLRALRGMGLRMALDDFGTGFASLSYLRAFSFDKIKIDQSFVRDATERPDCLAIVRSVAGLAADLGMVATAEGVEGPEHLAMVRGAGCAEAQGYHLGRPMPLAALGPLLQR